MSYTLLKSRLTIINVTVPVQTNQGVAYHTQHFCMPADESERSFRNALEELIKEAKRNQG